jgi:hypothetical protein
VAFNEALAERVREQLARRNGVVEKRMFGGVAFLLNGNMSVGVHGDDLIVRVAPDDAPAALKKKDIRVFDMTGKPMKGWLLVGPAATKTEAALAGWVAKGVDFAGALPPK